MIKFIKQHTAILLLALCGSCTDWACMEQYNPQGFWDQLKAEEKAANQPQPTLTEDGKLKEAL